MRKSTIIFNSKHLPIAFIVVLILFIATEAFIYSGRADLVKDFWNKFLINENELLKVKENYDYVIVGDSIQKTGINPLGVDGDIVNLGLPGGKPMSLFLLLNRYLKTHKSPKIIFLYIDPEDPHDSLYVILRFFVNVPELLSIWKDITWEERKVFLMKYWASLDIRKISIITRDVYPYSNKVFLETLIRNRGYMPSPRSEHSISNTYFIENGDRVTNDIHITEKDMKYLDKIVELAKSKDIKVVFLGFVMPRELYLIMKKTGFNEKYLKFFEKLKNRYSGTQSVNEPILYIDNKYFGDSSHVNKEGSKIYTEYFKNNIFGPATSIDKGVIDED